MTVFRITNLPNYCGGKLYKRWDKVTRLYGESGILASRTDKKGNSVQLLITEGGKRKQLISETSEIIDEIDSNGLKRTFAYERQPDGTTIGTMRIPKETPEQQKPLIVFAKWISKNLTPLFADFTLNTSHPKSLMTIKELVSGSTVLKQYKKRVEHIKIEHFSDGPMRTPLPSKLTLEDKNGVIKLINGTIEDTKPYIQQLDLIDGKPNIGDMRIIV